MPNLYINRTLDSDEQSVLDHEVPSKTGVMVVLAEPGAGKTEFLEYLSRTLGVPRQLATIFAHSPPERQEKLIIDAIDEVARIDETGTNQILVKAKNSNAYTIILASRSYIWDQARTQFARDCFGIEPLVLRLRPFNKNEQKRLFENYLPYEDFSAFQEEVERFELAPLLGNPQFLQLFADAYVEGGRRFTTKRQIYVDAVSRLASERRNSSSQRNRPPISEIVKGASEVFAKLLLSGVAGVSAHEDLGDGDYPYLQTVSSGEGVLPFALDTRLFRPTATTGKHEPVHRIVAEYCAAQYLVNRIQDSTRTLSIDRCLAVIAPNLTVRDELRGLLGWMASLGGRVIQEAVIALDPYAVFANGDPSQLLATSKRRLLIGLESLARVDPFFRRMDAWRRFSASGFFTEDIVDEVKRLLKAPDSKSHLKGLILELLEGSEACSGLRDELRALVLDPKIEVNQRLRAHRSLTTVSDHDHIVDFEILVAEGSADSLRIASEMVATLDVSSFGVVKILSLINALIRIYPNDNSRDRTLGSRYFVKQLIDLFESDHVRYLLDEFNTRIVCICGKTEPYRCSCRIGKSKIAGALLDRYFETAIGPHDPKRIAAWTRPLIFRGSTSEERSTSLKAFRANDGLRRAVQLIVAQSKADNETPAFFIGFSHLGLAMNAGDIKAVVDYAFESKKIALWKNFFASHDPYSERKEVNELRAHMRAQAQSDLEFLRCWSGLDRRYRKEINSKSLRRSRSQNRYARTQAKRRERHFGNLRQNRQQIESGRQWGWLQNFAFHYLYEPEKVSDIVDDPKTVERALRNCFEFVAPYVPSLEMLAEPRGGNVAMVLHAACLAMFRQNGTLLGIGADILRAVKVDGVGGQGYQKGEVEKFAAELDGLIFRSEQDAVDFATRYIEPQLSRPADNATQVQLVGSDPVFIAVRGRLALDWLTRFPKMPFSAREALFSIAAQHSDVAALKALIEARCAEAEDAPDSAEQTRKFWFLRHFFFVVPTSDRYWRKYSNDPKAIFEIESCAGRFTRDSAAGWPPLGAEKTYRILDAFVDQWPKVELPSSWGSGDPEEETAYRFLGDVIFNIGRDDPSVAIPVFERILADSRFADFESFVRSEKAASTRRLALSGYRPPKAREVVRLLDESKIASVEDLRALFVELFDEIQRRIKGAATDRVNVFYSGSNRVDENTARNRIVEMLEDRLNAINLSVVIEHHMANSKRCDFTASTIVDGKPLVLVTEVKGQWHPELYTAAVAQLADRYSIFPGAAHQGIYLVLWFGGEETVAGKRDASITTSDQLRQALVGAMPQNLRGALDVVVLDLWRPSTSKASVRRRRRKITKLTI